MGLAGRSISSEVALRQMDRIVFTQSRTLQCGTYQLHRHW